MGKTYRKAKTSRSWWGSEFSQRIYWIYKLANDGYVRALRNDHFVVKKRNAKLMKSSNVF